jgi:tetratricopeptide (TPR) repeat protein
MRICIDNLDSKRKISSPIPSFANTALCLFCLSLLVGPGCRAIDWDPSALRTSLSARDIAPLAIHHNSKGLKYLGQGKTAKAETHFLKAIDYDPKFAAAHNNLGNMLLARRDLYQAAWEFQRASELEPNGMEPLINLGLLHEEADRLEEAAEFYLQALQIDPRSPIAVGNLVRVKVKQESDQIEIHSMLRDLVLIDTRLEWIEWAQDLLATRYRPDYGAGLTSQPLSDRKPSADRTVSPPLNSNPLRLEQILPGTSTPQNLPSEMLPSPTPAVQYLDPLQLGGPSGPSFPNRPYPEGLKP